MTYSISMTHKIVKKHSLISSREEWMKDVYVVSCTVSVTANVTEESNLFRSPIHQNN